MARGQRSKAKTSEVEEGLNAGEEHSYEGESKVIAFILLCHNYFIVNFIINLLLIGG